MLVLVELSLIVNGRIHILPYGLGFTVVDGAHWVGHSSTMAFFPVVLWLTYWDYRS